MTFKIHDGVEIDGKSLTNSGGTLTWGGVSVGSGGGISINSNANNRVLTGDGSNAVGETNLTFDGTNLQIVGSTRGLITEKLYLGATDTSFIERESTVNIGYRADGIHKFSTYEGAWIQRFHITDNEVKVLLGELQITSGSSYTTHFNYQDGGNNIISQGNSATTAIRDSVGNRFVVSSTGGAFMQKLAVMSTAPHASYDFYNNGTSYFNGNVVVDANLTLSGGGQILGSPAITAARVVTSGLYGTGHNSSILPIWQYNAGNTGYGIGYYEGSPDTIRFDVSGHLMSGTPDFQISQNIAYINGNEVWHAGNDGTGSGLDADKLDGLELHTARNDNVNKVVRTDANGYLNTGWINTTSGARTTQAITRVYASDDAYLRYYTLANFGDQIASHINYNSLENKPTIPTNNNQLTNGAGYITSFTETNAFIGDGGNASTHPGTSRAIYTGQLTAGTPVLGMPTNDNSNSILTLNRHSGNYNSQIGFSSNGNMYYRSFGNVAINNSTTWRTVWDSGNDGTGSGLDADLLDGEQGVRFLKSYSSSAPSGWQNSNMNFSIRSGGAATGLHMEESDGTFGFQIYGDSGSYGFLDGEWASWDIQKVVNGTFKVDEGSGLKRVLNEANWSSYISIPSLSGYATESYVGTQIANLVDSSPAALNTLNELAAAIGDDASFSTTITNSIATKLPLVTGVTAMHNTQGTQSTANTVLRTQVNGYTMLGWINTVSGATSSTLQRVYCSEDGYIRFQTPANFGASISGHINYNNIANKPTIPTNNNQLTNGAGYITASNGAITNKAPLASPSITGTATINQLKIGGASNGFFYSDISGRTAFNSGDFYIQNSVTNYYNYATNQYIGDNSGDNIHFRGNVVDGTGWSINGAGKFVTRDIQPEAGYVYMRSNHNSGHLEGSYNNVGANSSKTNPIYTIGASYNPGDTSLSNMYGIGYTEISAGSVGFTGAAGWGMYVAADGDARVWLDGSNGVISSTGQHYVGSNVVWNAGNDGSGSGLDADTLDGLELHTSRNDNANKVVRTDSNGYIQAGWINTPSGDAGAIVPTRIYTNDGGGSDQYIRYLDLASFRSVMNVTAKAVYQGREQNTSDTNYWVGSMGYGTTTFDNLFKYGSGSIDTWSNPSDQPSGTSHWVGHQHLHYHQGTYGYGHQEIMGAGSPALAFVRGRWGSGAWGSWYKNWNAANDGAGSGLDADLLDGYNAEETSVNNSIVKRDGNATIQAKNLHLTGGNYEGSIVFGTQNDWHTGIRQHDDGDAEMRIWAKNSGGRIHIATGYDGEPTSIVRPTDGFVLNANNVGIGNFSSIDPAQKLHVIGNILMTGSLNGNANNTSELGSYPGGGAIKRIRMTQGGEIHFGDTTTSNFLGITEGVVDNFSDQDRIGIYFRNEMKFFSNSNTLRHTFDVSGNYTAVGNITAYSDIRLKDDLQPIEDAVSKVQKLRGVTYVRNDNEDENRQAGLIAQDVELVLPEAVREAEDGIKTVNYNSTIALLVEAIKEQQEQINQLKKEIKGE